MVWNDTTPKIDIDPETYEVKTGRQDTTVDPASGAIIGTKDTLWHNDWDNASRLVV